MKLKLKLKSRSAATDFITKGIILIFVFIITLFGFNYLISGTLYAVEFWNMVSGVLALIASFIALIVFSRKAIIEGYYISSHDYTMATFYDEIEEDPNFAQTYYDINDKYPNDAHARVKALEPLMSHYFYLNFKYYIDNMNSIEKFIIKLYSVFVVGSYSTHLELSRARRRNWFDSNNDFD
ncbi:hypothetical protein BOVMAS02_14630 [Streptococcus uberis]|uniref:hypothetical protein n=1 Tax=Streptococcus uberis TaxID=1349 RepID=UPI0027DCD2FC|nr:hypothetical protein [Streptococcus uberis]MCK1192967.1 hypothetical protein [Streptococcus uberis]MCK1244595.1 hypothetical protein [Streptococcus uberis]MCK1246878.1 hypothetical protein [Streptococcus uberis]